MKAIRVARVFAWLAGPLLKRPLAALAIPALWVALEWTHAPLGFQWLMLGNAGINMSLPMRIAPFTGVYGLSFLFALMATVIALVFRRAPRLQFAQQVQIVGKWRGQQQPVAPARVHQFENRPLLVQRMLVDRMHQKLKAALGAAAYAAPTPAAGNKATGKGGEAASAPLPESAVHAVAMAS